MKTLDKALYSIILVIALVVVLLLFGYKFGTIKLPFGGEIAITPPGEAEIVPQSTTDTEIALALTRDAEIALAQTRYAEIALAQTRDAEIALTQTRDAEIALTKTREAEIADGLSEATIEPDELLPRIVFERILTDTNGSGKLDFDDNSALVLTNVDGSEEIKLTDGTSNARDASWSPDGKSIVFASDADGDFDIYIIREDEGSWKMTDEDSWEKIINSDKTDRGPSWSPNGQWIAFHSDRDKDKEIYRYQLDNSEVKQLTDNIIQDEFPTWYYDSKWIAYQSGDDCPFVDCRIYTIDSEGQNQRVYFKDVSFWPSWSPDGRFLGASIASEGREANIYTWELESEVEKQLTDYNSTAQSWSPDGEQIAYASWENGGSKVWIMNSDGTDEPRPLTSTGLCTRPVYSP